MLCCVTVLPQTMVSAEFGAAQCYHPKSNGTGHGGILHSTDVIRSAQLGFDSSPCEGGNFGGLAERNHRELCTSPASLLFSVSTQWQMVLLTLL